MATNTTITLGGKDLLLAPPKSYTVRLEVAVAVERNHARAAAAALALCWQSPDRPRAKYAYDVMAFGGAVIDELCGERRLNPGDVVTAGNTALALCGDGLFTAAEVAAAVGNSEAGDAPAP